MSDIGDPEQSRNTNILNHKMGRRAFLGGVARGAGKAAVAATTLAVAGALPASFLDLALNPDADRNKETNPTPDSQEFKPRSSKTLEELGVTVIDERNTGAISESIKEEPVVESVSYRDAFEEINPFLEDDFPEQAAVLRQTVKNYQITQEQGGRVGIGLPEDPANRTMKNLLKMKIYDEGSFTEFENLLVKEAEKNNLNPDIIKGIIFIESHGDKYAESDAGALGIAQFMPDTGHLYGLLKYDKDGNLIADNRTDPVESVKAMCEYLGYLRNLFGGNMGLATWAYHAGEGNVMTALRLYFKDKTNVDIGDYGESPYGMQLGISARARGLLEKNHVSVFRLLKHPSVVKFIEEGIPEEGKRKLENDTRNYATKAAAAAKYYENNPYGSSV